jgi:hypothetical protein
MKKAILVLVSEDRRTGRPVSDILPYSDANKAFKEAIAAGEGPDPAFPRLELWEPSGKSHRFKQFRGVSSYEEEISAAAEAAEAEAKAAAEAAEAEAKAAAEAAEAAEAEAKAAAEAAEAAEAEAKAAPTDIHPTGVSPSATENGSPNDATAVDTASDPPSTTEVSSAPKPKKRH